MGSEDINDLILEIEAAEKKCEEFDDPEKIVFRTILKCLDCILTNNLSLSSVSDHPQEIYKDVPECIKKICNATKISPDDLKHIFDFDFENKKLELKTMITGKNAEEKQFKATLCILTGYNYCYGTKEIKSEELKTQLDQLGIDSLGNMSTFLKKARYKEFIKVEGKDRGPKKYKIKIPGIKKGEELIKSLMLPEKEKNHDQ